jgi:hypothetical protein
MENCRMAVHDHIKVNEELPAASASDQDENKW